MEAEAFPFASWLKWCVLVTVCAFMLLSALDPRRKSAPAIVEVAPARVTLAVPVEGITPATFAGERAAGFGALKPNSMHGAGKPGLVSPDTSCTIRAIPTPASGSIRHQSL